MYASSPRWRSGWIGVSELREVLEILAPSIRGHTRGDDIGVNKGLHFTGGEPFLNYDLLIEGVRMARELEIPATFVETNCFWCTDEDKAERIFRELKREGLHGVLISSNPFLTEFIPFRRIRLGIRAARRVFGSNVIVYHPLFHSQLERLGIDGTIRFEEFLKRAIAIDPSSLYISLSHSLILPMGRAVTRLSRLYRGMPAKSFSRERCIEELTRPWHIHIDNYMNYISGYCSGISLGDVRRLDEMKGGIDLDEHPILGSLIEGIGRLLELAKGYGYEERREGYISKCHLCLDIRSHLVGLGLGFRELEPKEFYEHL